MNHSFGGHSKKELWALGVSILGTTTLTLGFFLVAGGPVLAQYTPGPDASSAPSDRPNAAAPTQSYDNNILNYTINYPRGWNYTSQPDGSTVFEGPNDANVTITPETGSDLAGVVANLKNAYMNNPASHAQISDEQSFDYNSSGGTSVSGRYFQVDYTDPASNESYRALVVVVPMNGMNNQGNNQDNRGSGSSQFLEFTYSAPTSQFGAYSKDAQAMFNSWAINS